MSLIIYEFKRADNAGEISQFRATLPIMQEHYQGKNEVVLYLSGRLNINGVDIDGLIIKEDAIVLVEFKNYSGAIKAQANGDWFIDDKRINGGAKKKDGSFKTVFEQLCINRRALREGLAYYTKNIDACKNIQALVVFSSYTSLQLDNDFKWGGNAWVNVTDIERIAEALDTIKAKKHNGNPIVFDKEDIFDFIRQKGLDERYIVTKYSDVNILPEDLYHEEKEHNGDDYSPNTLLAKVTEEKNRYQASLHDAVGMIQSMMQKMESMAKEKDLIIQQQKAELLQIKAEMLLEKSRTVTSNDDEVVKKSLEEEQVSLMENIHEVQENVEKIEKNDSAISVEAHRSTKKRFGLKQRTLKSFNVDTESMDDDQLELIDKTIDKSMIVSGCAGSGKSVIAMYKAEQILEKGEDVILIAYTKSLNRYMCDGKQNKLGKRFFYHWQWKHEGKPSADYIIVDEIQDFDCEEIEEFRKAANKNFFFFGDTAQSIYRAFGKKTMSMDEISKLTGIPILYLYNNYRLPKPVAQITQDYLGLNEKYDMVRKYSDDLYLSKENTLPVFIECKSNTDQIKNIISVIEKKSFKNVGILVQDNDEVLEIMNAFTFERFACEFKYNAGYNDPKNKDTLNFKTEIPKLMTYHSAKGLQFETVILPYYKGTKSNDSLKALYVAMTRTYRNLYILYSNILEEPLSNVPERLFTKTTSPTIL